MACSAVVRLVHSFRAWDDARPHHADRAGVCPLCLESLLEGRTAYLDRPDPTRWRRGDVRALLYDLAVPRLTEFCDLAAHTVPTVAAYLTFLDETDRLHPGSAAPRLLLQELAQHAAGFPAAMADRSRYRLAKTLYSAMLAEGVDPEDDDAVDAWAEQFSQAPEDQRTAVLHHLLPAQPELRTARFVARAGKVAAVDPDQPVIDSRLLLPLFERPPEVLPSFPPVAVPSPDTALADVRRSVLTHRLLTLARWFAPGRKPTKDGEPIPADVRRLAAHLGLTPPMTKVGHLHEVPHLRELFWLARQLELVDLRRTALITGPRLQPWHNGSTAGDEDDLELWFDVFRLITTAQEIPEEAPLARGPVPRQVAPWIRQALGTILGALYRAAAEDAGRPVTALIASRTKELLDRLGPRSWEADFAARDGFDDLDDLATADAMTDIALRLAIGQPLDRLIDHGLLALYWADGVEPAEEPQLGGLPPRTLQMIHDDQARLRLTPLGRWAMSEELTAEGAEAPTVPVTP